MIDRPAGRAPRHVRRLLRRRSLLVAAGLVVAWMAVAVAIMGVATGNWGNRLGGKFAIGVVTVVVGAATAVAYRRVSGPVGDLLAGGRAGRDGGLRNRRGSSRAPRASPSSP